jgi:hypothetical protein
VKTQEYEMSSNFESMLSTGEPGFRLSVIDVMDTYYLVNCWANDRENLHKSFDINKAVELIMIREREAKSDDYSR